MHDGQPKSAASDALVVQRAKLCTSSAVSASARNLARIVVAGAVYSEGVNPRSLAASLKASDWSRSRSEGVAAADEAIASTFSAAIISRWRGVSRENVWGRKRTMTRTRTRKGSVGL